MLSRSRFIASLLTLAMVPATPLLANETESTLEFRLAVDDETEGWKNADVRNEDKPVYLSPDTFIRGDLIDEVSFTKDANGQPAVGIKMSPEGGESMRAITSQNVGKKLAIVLDGEVVSAPKIMSAVSSEMILTGNFDKEDLRSFFEAIVLRETADDEPE